MDTRNTKRQMAEFLKRKPGQRGTPGRAPRKQLCSRYAQRLRNKKKTKTSSDISAREGPSMEQSSMEPLVRESPSRESSSNEFPLIKQEHPENQLQIRQDQNGNSFEIPNPTINPNPAEENPNEKEVQVYPSQSDVQTQTEVPYDRGFCDLDCRYIMTGVLCNPFCRFTPK